MPNGEKTEARIRKAAWASDFVTVALSVSALLGWLVNNLVLARIEPSFIPMAPATAIVFLIFSVSYFLELASVRGRIVGSAKVFLAVTGLLFAASVLFSFFFPSLLDLERFLFGPANSFGQVPIGRMSPITATLFILTGAALVMLPIKPAGAGAASILGAIIDFSSLSIALGYLYNAPLLYGGTIIPVALTTAIAFAGLGTGMILIAGASSRPLRALAGPSVRAKILRPFLILVVGVAVISGWLSVSKIFGLNQALFVSLSALVSIVIATAVTARLARNIGGAIDRTEAALKRGNKTLALVRSCNEVLVRAQDERELLRNICELIVAHGGYCAAWVGYAEADTVKMIVRAGDRAGTDSEPDREPMRAAVRTGEPQRGDMSLALPLISGGDVNGVLNIDAIEADDFNDHEVSLLVELANDLAYGIMSLRTREKQRRTEAEIEHLSYHDLLTGLPNRRLFEKELRQELNYLRKKRDPVTLFHVRLDQFTRINQAFGPETGDLVLRVAAERLKRLAPEGSTVAKIGGEEYAVMPASAKKPDVPALATEILSALSKPYQAAGHEIFITASLGIGLYPDDGDSAASLLRAAGDALRQAQEEGGNKHKFFREEEQAVFLEKIATVNDLNHALERREIEVFYQPILDIRSDRILSVEALARWNSPRRGLVSPSDFIPLAEETGFIVPMGMWVLKTACGQCKEWLDAGFGPLTVSVNLSPKQFRDERLAATIADVLRQTGLNANNVIIELTEGAIMEHPRQTATVIQELGSSGIGIAIDDFGTGYSSLSYLKNLAVDILKIDKVFISEVTTHDDTAAIVTALIALARSLKIQVIAEGVETPEQLRFLRAAGADGAQGFLIGRPKPATEIESLLKDKRFRDSAA